MTTNQPESTEERLARLEDFFADVAELVVAQNQAIDSLTANVNNFTEQTTRNINTLVEQAAIDRQAWNDIAELVVAQDNTIEMLTANFNNLAEQTTRNISTLVEQAAADRQLAAIDRQAWQTEIRRIWEYLLQQSGNGRGGNGV